MYSCTSEGEPLVEIFGVRFPHGGQAPAGSVSVFDGKRGQIIYSGSNPADKPSSPRQKRFGGGLPLTGPYRAISADGCVAIVLDLHDTTASSSPTTCYVDEILLDVYAETTKYDERITSSVSSACGSGRAEVTYALLSDAAEAVVQVRLLGRGPASGGSVVGGTVVARTCLGEVVLFDDDGASVGTGTEDEEEPAGVVPLARSVVAVPLASSLTVELDLVVVDGHGNGEEAVTASVLCVPKLGSEDVQQCGPTARAGAVEVKIRWLD